MTLPNSKASNRSILWLSEECTKSNLSKTYARYAEFNELQETNELERHIRALRIVGACVRKILNKRFCRSN